eukprot:TRINITY_DN8870_c0_g1_i1.p1 TRINITY_DN8870_c0_g1~~TRINITY_DN8870_c0_g1_i1.p1  ORF type:complete len:292 (+),score=70.95 TRINITY_DN8870_c0_g1_i1:74-877(+)
MVMGRTEVTRESVHELWEQGKVAGLFNLSTKEQFDACFDFCVEAPDAEILEDSHPKIRKLQKVTRSLVEAKLSLSQSLAESRSEVSEIAKEMLLQTEAHEVELQNQRETILSLKSLTKKLRAQLAEKDELSEEIQTLKSSLESVQEERNDLKAVADRLERDLKTTDADLTRLHLQKHVYKIRVTKLEEERENNSTYTQSTEAPGQPQTVTERLNQQLLTEYLQFVGEDFFESMSGSGEGGGGSGGGGCGDSGAGFASGSGNNMGPLS